MNWTGWVPLLVIGSSLTAALLIFPLAEERNRLRGAINVGAAIVKLLLVAFMVIAVGRGVEFETELTFLPGVALAFRADFLGLLFISLSAVLWLVTTIYALAYFRDSPDKAGSSASSVCA
jgi:multicomponent Na+:H+ antiporter subunit D